MNRNLNAECWELCAVNWRRWLIKRSSLKTFQKHTENDALYLTTMNGRQCTKCNSFIFIWWIVKLSTHNNHHSSHPHFQIVMDCCKTLLYLFEEEKKHKYFINGWEDFHSIRAYDNGKMGDKRNFVYCKTHNRKWRFFVQMFDNWLPMISGNWKLETATYDFLFIIIIIMEITFVLF